MSIEVKNLSFAYGEREILHDISFTIKKGEFVSILGSNGVGKSTLFRCILGLLPDYKGDILIEGKDIKKLSVKELSRLVAYIPQNTSPAFNYTVEDIVLMGTTSSLGVFKSPGKEEMERVQWAMEKMGIEKLRKRSFNRISGGERQLAVIARALVQQAGILMLDEPTASLDFGNQMLVLSQAKALAAEGYTVIQTTHNPEHSYMFSDRVLALKDGRLLKEGDPKDIITKEVIDRLYGISVEVPKLFDDRARGCIPSDVALGHEI